MTAERAITGCGGRNHLVVDRTEAQFLKLPGIRGQPRGELCFGDVDGLERPVIVLDFHARVRQVEGAAEHAAEPASFRFGPVSGRAEPFGQEQARRDTAGRAERVHQLEVGLHGDGDHLPAIARVQVVTGQPPQFRRDQRGPRTRRGDCRRVLRRARTRLRRRQPRDTPAEPRGPWVLPGDYKVKLTVNGQSRVQPLLIRMDPRVHVSREELAQQFALSMQCYQGMSELHQAQEEIRKLRAKAKERREQLKSGPLADALNDQRLCRDFFGFRLSDLGFGRR